MNNSTMATAWTNAATAQQWHGKGSKAQYLSGSLKLAHKGVNLKKRLNTLIAVAVPVAFVVGGMVGSLVANIVLGA